MLEKQRFAKHRVKDFFDEVYIRHARGLDPDLFAAQWNHMAYFDELHSKGAQYREDIATWFDLLDLDDYISFGGKA